MSISRLNVKCIRLICLSVAAGKQHPRNAPPGPIYRNFRPGFDPNRHTRNAYTTARIHARSQSFRRLGLPAPTERSNFLMPGFVDELPPSERRSPPALSAPVRSYPRAAVEVPISPGAPTALWMGAGLGGPWRSNRIQFRP